MATCNCASFLSNSARTGSEAADTFEKLAGKSFTEFIAQGGNLAGTLAIMEQEARPIATCASSDMFGNVEVGADGPGADRRGRSEVCSGVPNAAGRLAPPKYRRHRERQPGALQEALAKTAKER